MNTTDPVYPNKFVHTIIIWNVQFHLASFYLMASLLTLTEADIYLAGSLLPEILLTVQILSTQLQILSTQSTKYRQMSSNIDKCQQISTNIDFNVIFPGFLTEFQGFSRISRIFLNSRVFPGFPGFPGSVDTLHNHHHLSSDHSFSCTDMQVGQVLLVAQDHMMPLLSAFQRSIYYD